MHTMKSTQEKHSTNWFTYLTVITVDLLGFSYGLMVTWSSPTLLKLENVAESPFGYAITSEQASWITSLLSFGSMCGPLPFGYVSNKFGRKVAILGMGVLMLTAYLLLAFGKTIELYYAARFIAGCSGGGIFSLVGMYKSEMAHHQDRSKLYSLGVIIFTSGMLVPYVIGPYVSVMAFNLMCAVIPGIFCVTFALFMYETPPYLISVGKHEQAHETLKKFRTETPEAIEKELAEIQEYVREHENEGTIIDILRSRVLLKCIGIILFLVTVQHLTGVTPLVSYTQEIFEAAGAGLSSDVSTIVVGSMQLIITLGTPFITKRFKFRTLLTCSGVGLAIFLTPLGLYFYLEEKTEVDTSSLGWMPIVTMIGLFFSYTFGFAVVPGIMMTEIFPTNVRSMAITVAYVIGSLQGFVINKYFLTVSELVGIGWCFWFFAASSAVSTVIVLLVVPETNGKTFQEIQDMLRRK